MSLPYYTPLPTRVFYQEYPSDRLRDRASRLTSVDYSSGASVPKSTPAVVYELKGRLGKKLVAYIAGVTQRGIVDSWIEGSTSVPPGVRERLRFAHSLVNQLLLSDAPSVAQAWLTGVNPALGDRVPITLLRDGDLSVEGDSILAAARSFSGNG